MHECQHAAAASFQGWNFSRRAEVLLWPRSALLNTQQGASNTDSVPVVRQTGLWGHGTDLELLL